MKFTHLKLPSISHFQYYANVILGMKCLRMNVLRNSFMNERKKKWKKSHPKWTEGHGLYSVKESSGWWNKRLLLLQAEICPPIRLSTWLLHGLICSTQRRKQTMSKWVFIENVFNFMFSLKHDRRPYICKVKAAYHWNKPDFTQEVDSFSHEDFKTMWETTEILKIPKDTWMLRSFIVSGARNGTRWPWKL